MPALSRVISTIVSSALSTSQPQPIAIGELEAAINRARLAQPASGVEAVLAREVAVLGSLYGRLIWERRTAVAWDELSDGERMALRLWLVTPTGRP